MRRIRFRLREILQARDIRQKDFAKTIGVRYPTICDYCTNHVKSIPLENIEKICHELDITHDELLTFEEVPDEQVHAERNERRVYIPEEEQQKELSEQPQ